MSITIAEQMQQLYSQFGQLPGVTIELHKNLLAIQVENAKATATVFLQGAQLSHYQLHKQPPIIWCSQQCNYAQGQPLRGGIPLCWPWFGNLSQNPAPIKQQIGPLPQAPAHGFARNQVWQLKNIDILNDELTRLCLTLSLQENEHPYWPYACDLRLTILISSELTVQLHIQNLSSKAVTFSSALHSYFAVSDIEQVAVNGLDELTYIDCTNNWQTHTQYKALIIDQEIDRIYTDTHQDITLIDQAWNRVINVQSKGSSSTVIWNPWKNKAKTLSHFSNDAYKDMLCIETANIHQDYVQLSSGESHQMEVVISQHSLV